MGGLGGATGALAGGRRPRCCLWRWVLLVNGRLPRRRARRTAGGFCARAVAGPGALVRPARGAQRDRGARARDLRDRQQRALRADRGDHVGTIAAGGALLGLFLVIEGRLATAPLVPLAMFVLRALSAANAALLCLGAVTFSMWVLLTVYLQRVLGLSALEAGLAFAPISLTIVASTRLGSRLSTWLGLGRVVAAGMAVLGVGMLLFARIDAGGSWGATRSSRRCCARPGSGRRSSQRHRRDVRRGREALRARLRPAQHVVSGGQLARLRRARDHRRRRRGGVRARVRRRRPAPASGDRRWR